MAMFTIRPAIRASALAAFWLVFLVTFFVHWPIPFFRPLAFGLIALVVIVWSAAGYGQFAAERSLPRDTTAAEFLIFSVAIGYGVICLMMTVLGAVGAWTRAAAAILLLLGFVLQMLKRKPLLALRLRGSVPWMPAALVAVGAGASLLLTLSPITYYDSLVYHLAMPAAYVQAHRWVPLTSLIYSSFPQNMEMLWTLGLLISGGTLVNLIGWSLAALLVAGVLSFAGRYLSRQAGWYAAALLAVMPAFLLLSSGGYVDVGLACFSFLSFYAVLLWRDSENPWALAAAGALGGWAIGCKYTGVIPFCIGAGVVVASVHRQPMRRLLTALALYGAAGLICVAPWLIKNIHYVGNPLFPFFHEWGVAQKNPWVGKAAEGYFAGLTEYRPHKPWELFQLLWQMGTHGLDFGHGMDVLGDLGWAPLLALLPALAFAKGRTVIRWLAVYVALFFAAWGMTRPVLRFLMPAAPLLALLAGYAWSSLRRGSPAWLFRASQLVIALLLASNLALFFYTADLLSLFSVPLGIETRDAFLRRRLNYYAAAQFVNASPDVRSVFIVGDQRGYYYDKPTWITPVFNKSPLVEWAEAAPSSEALRARLKSMGITHLVVNNAEAERLSPYGILTLTEAAQQRWDSLRGALRRVYHDEACDIFAL